MADGRILTRRAFVAVAVGSLAACSSERPRAGLLGVAERWNERVQRMLFDPQRLAPELPASATTKAGELPAYYISPGPPPAPPGWRLRVGGLVVTPVALSLTASRAGRPSPAGTACACAMSPTASGPRGRRATSSSARSTAGITRAGTARAHFIHKPSSPTA